MAVTMGRIQITGLSDSDIRFFYRYMDTGLHGEGDSAGLSRSLYSVSRSFYSVSRSLYSGRGAF